MLDGKVPDDLNAVNKAKGWNEFIRQILIRLHNNGVSFLQNIFKLIQI